MSAIDKESQKRDMASSSLAASPPAGEARRMLEPLKHEIVQLLQRLVQIDTVAIPPNGSETAGQLVLQGYLQTYDLDVEIYELEFLARANHPYVRADRNYSGRHNLITRLSGTGRGRSLLLSGHMDTVPAGYDEWLESPWSGAVREGRLYGRGSYDMKGGLVAAFAVAVALKKEGRRLGGDLFCESVIDEEWGGGGGTLAARVRGDIADACVIPEPTDLAIFRASRGGFFVDINIRAGDPQNYFSKDEVVSPAIPMGRLLGWVDHWTARRRAIDRGEAYSEFSDPAPVQVLALEANRFDREIPWSVPLMGRLRLYFQFLPHEDVASVIAEIEQSFRRFCADDTFFSVYKPEWQSIFDPPLLGHELPVDHEWTQALVKGAAATLEKAPTVTAAEYPCDAFLNQKYFGIPTLVFGPCGAGPHNTNEYVEVRSVLQTAEALLTTALEWCGAG
ncbi:MAG TPA: M20/M25/M40 family metallo-hydrolase [Pyrinomonadaceae bacterium]|nr:M20/M25/M40 family metallo-hydrolase [Pyrinomonadaceae bacterium]